jgi:pimeloyl-ACP methyl ester carboxylesterase
MHIRTYGQANLEVVVLHGGPAAAGEAGPIARGLADTFRVLEPWQRGSGDEPLSVARHIADLHEVVKELCRNARPALVGESWGAMLALAYAAAHPEEAGPIVLVGCGTFDPVSRARLREALEQRTTDELRRRIGKLADEYPNPDEQLRELYRLTEPLYAFDPVEERETDPDVPPLDTRAHIETWEDMLRLQEEDVYPARFAAIGSPVLMLHGDYDPHPGLLIRSSLSPYISRLEFRELRRCGHRPWLEKHARAEFFSILRDWLVEHGARD